MILGMISVVSMIGIVRAHAGEAPAKGELQDMGERFGRFMGSFVQEMGQAAVKQDPNATSRLDGSRENGDRRVWDRNDVSREGWRSGLSDDRSGDVRDAQRGSRYRSNVPTYDPWGVRDWGYGSVPTRRYDPWGSTAAYADWDWEMGRWYYGAGALAPWERDALDGRGGYDGSSSGWGGRPWGGDGYDPGYGGWR
ncbi:MAG: hypothetical protein HQL75_14030 [Magnetococcales bacterium]|nr:hypothetical protein [Magnetococcales bacterium]